MSLKKSFLVLSLVLLLVNVLVVQADFTSPEVDNTPTISEAPPQDSPSKDAGNPVHQSPEVDNTPIAPATPESHPSTVEDDDQPAIEEDVAESNATPQEQGTVEVKKAEIIAAEEPKCGDTGVYIPLPFVLLVVGLIVLKLKF